jgi:hypothetical protein
MGEARLECAPEHLTRHVELIARSPRLDLGHPYDVLAALAVATGIGDGLGDGAGGVTAKDPHRSSYHIPG